MGSLFEDYELLVKSGLFDPAYYIRSNPDVAATSRRGHTTVFASWNGATGVAFWRVRNARRQSLATVPRRDFETAIRVVPSAYVQVQALDARHRVLASSALIRA